MPYPRPHALRALGAVVLLALLTGCTTPSGDEPTGEPSSSAASPSGTPSTSPSASASASATASPSSSPSSSSPAPTPSASPTSSPPPETPDPALNEVTATITHVELNGDVVVVNAGALGAVEDGGTCLLEVTTSSGTQSTSAPAFPDATSTWCDELSVSAPGAASGDEVTVVYTSATSSGRASSQIP